MLLAGSGAMCSRGGGDERLWADARRRRRVNRRGRDQFTGAVAPRPTPSPVSSRRRGSADGTDNQVQVDMGGTPRQGRRDRDAGRLLSGDDRPGTADALRVHGTGARSVRDGSKPTSTCCGRRRWAGTCCPRWTRRTTSSEPSTAARRRGSRHPHLRTPTPEPPAYRGSRYGYNLPLTSVG